MRASAQQQHPRLVSDSERPGAGVGAILRGARLARDEELREVASALRIRLPYLEAIEEGRIEDLPGVTYGIGFVRGYAEYLGLDAADIVSRFKLEARGIDKRTQLHFPEPLPGNRVPGAALLLLVLILAGGVYGGWLYTTSQNMTFTEAVEALPQRFQEMLAGEDAAETAARPSVEEAAPVTPPAVPKPEAAEAPAPAATPETETEQSATTGEDTPPPTTEVDVSAPVQESVSAATADAAAERSEQPSQSATAANEPAASQSPAPEPAATETAGSETPAVAQQNVTVANTADTDTAATDTAARPADPTGGAAADTTIPAPEPETTASTASITAPEAEPAPSATETAAAEAGSSQEAAPEAQPAQTAAVAPESEPSAESAIVTEELSAPPPLPEDTASASAATAGAEPAATGNTAPSAGSGARIIIQATNESWIQVVDAGGDVLVEKLMLMGEIYRVPDREGLKLNTGNAGALKLIVNGTLAPPLSTEPEVMRNIDLSPQALTQ